MPTFGFIRPDNAPDQLKEKLSSLADSRDMSIDGWILDTVGTGREKGYDRHALETLLSPLEAGDTLVASDITGLGKSIVMILDVVRICLEKGCPVHTLEDGYSFDDPTNFKAVAGTLTTVINIHKDFVSKSTARALAARKDSAQLTDSKLVTPPPVGKTVKLR